MINLWWNDSRDYNGTEITLPTGRFELQTSSLQRYLSSSNEILGARGKEIAKYSNLLTYERSSCKQVRYSKLELFDFYHNFQWLQEGFNCGPHICKISYFIHWACRIYNTFFFFLFFFFLSGFTFTDTDNSQDSREREGIFIYSTLSLPPAHEHSDI